MSSHKQDDLWCHDCGKSVPGICKKHGGFTQVFDNAIPSRARLTCPAGLVIKQVKNADGKTSFGIFAKRIIQCRSQFGPLYGPVTSTEKAPIRNVPKSKETEKSEPSSPTDTTGDQNGVTSVETTPSDVSTQSQIKTNEIQRQLSQQEQLEMMSQGHQNSEQLILQNIQGFTPTPDINMQSQMVTQQYTQNNQALANSNAYLSQNVALQHPNLDKATQEQIMNIQNSLQPGPYGDGGMQHLTGGYTPQQALDIVTTMSNVSNPVVSQFDQAQLSINQDLTLQASIEAGIAPPEGYVNSAGMTETQLLEHSIAVAQQELQKLTSEPLPTVQTSNMGHPQTVENHTSTEQITQLQAEELSTEQASSGPHTTQTGQLISPAVDSTGDGNKEKNVDNDKKESEEVDEPSEEDFTYEIKVFKDDGYVDTIDISDEDKCNWMMFVRPARHTAEQNVVVCQQDQQIYFVSIKPIPSNTEIKVWYSAEYAEMMGKPLLPDPQPIITEATAGVPTGVTAKWVCSVCYDGFSAFAELEAHLCPGLPPDSRRLRGRPRKGRPRKYIKPSKTWRARLEKSRMLKAKVVDPTQTLPPRRRGRPPKNRRPALDIPPPLQVEELPDDNIMEGIPEEKDDMEVVLDEEEDDEKATTEMLDEILGEEEEYPEPIPRRRGRKKGRVHRGPRASRREPMQCPHCPETFTKEASFVIHVSEHTGIKPFICEVPECAKGFMSKFKLERHRLIHTCPRHHKCPYCDKSFNRKDHLKNHMITHDPNKKRWVCEECGKEYSYNFSYRTHKAFHDADAGRSTECGICHKQHETREELLYHLKVHSGARSVKNCTEKIHGCPECGKKFYTRKDVRRHMITHTKKKDFLCQFCPQRFGRKDHLTRHLRSSHSGDNANKPPRAPRGERKEKLKEYEKVSAAVFQALNIPRDIPREDPAVLVTSQPNINSIYHTMQTADGRELAVPIQLYENNTQSILNMTNMQNLQHQQQIPTQMQNMQVSSIASQMQLGDQRYIDASAIRHQQQTIDPTGSNQEYRSLQHQVQTHGAMYLANPQQQQQQPQQPQQIPQQQIINKDGNLDMIRSNGVIPAEYQVNREQTNRPTVVQSNDTRQQSQTFSTLLGYMETLRFLENLPTTAQGGVIAQIEGGPPTMVPIQSSTYTGNAPLNMTHQNEMQKRIQLPVTQQVPQQQHTYQPQT